MTFNINTTSYRTIILPNYNPKPITYDKGEYYRERIQAFHS